MDSREKLIEIASRHAAHLERLKSHSVGEYVTFLEQMDDELRKMINGRKPIGEHTIPELEKKLAGVKAKLLAINDAIFDKFEDQAKALAKSEAAFEIKSLGQAIEKDFSLPTNAQISKAVFAAPLTEIKGVNGGALLKDFFKGALEGQADNILGQIRAGFFRGDTTKDISSRILGTVAKGQNDGELAKTWRAINGAVRTGLQHSAVQARKETWANNKDIVKMRRIVAVLDDRTADVDRALDGREFPLDSGPVPPFHVNCFPCDTDVLSCSAITRIYKRTYKGRMVYIRTKAGRAVEVTPNHPILTAAGWKPAGEINCTDKLFCISAPQKIIHNNKNTIHAEFGEMFSTFKIAVDSSAIANTPTSAEDFHGDGLADADVDIVNINSESRDSVGKLLMDRRKNYRLLFRRFAESVLSGFCSAHKFIARYLSACGSVMGIKSKLGYIFRACVFHSLRHCLAWSSDSYKSGGKRFGYHSSGAAKAKAWSYLRDPHARFMDLQNSFFGFIGKFNFFGRFYPTRVENVFNWVETNADLLPNLLNSQAFDGIEIDNVVSVETGENNFFGHVYNIENEGGWYSANGIIAHNCRCVEIAVLDKRFAVLEQDGTRSARPEGGKITSVEAKQTYYGFLKDQPREYVESVIGKSRAKLLLNGGLTAERFTELQLNKRFEPITLEEMKRIEPLAFIKAGIE